VIPPVGQPCLATLTTGIAGATFLIVKAFTSRAV
jgi:hypothetical protein